MINKVTINNRITNIQLTPGIIDEIIELTNDFLTDDTDIDNQVDYITVKLKEKYNKK